MVNGKSEKSLIFASKMRKSAQRTLGPHLDPPRSLERSGRTKRQKRAIARKKEARGECLLIGGKPHHQRQQEAATLKGGNGPKQSPRNGSGGKRSKTFATYVRKNAQN